MPLGGAGPGDADGEDLRLRVQDHLGLEAAEGPAVQRAAFRVHAGMSGEPLGAVDKVLGLRLADLFEVRLLKLGAVAGCAAGIDCRRHPPVHFSHVPREEVARR